MTAEEKTQKPKLQSDARVEALLKGETDRTVTIKLIISMIMSLAVSAVSGYVLYKAFTTGEHFWNINPKYGVLILICGVAETAVLLKLVLALAKFILFNSTQTKQPETEESNKDNQNN